jgi:hypothetical protein
VISEYVVSGDMLARAWDWCDKALSGKQTVDEIVEGKKTGKKLPVVLDDAGRKRFELLKTSIEQEIERRQIEREDAKEKASSVTSLNTESDAEMASLDSVEPATEEKGEAYEGD